VREMSDLMEFGYDPKKAADFNERAEAKLNFYDKMPLAALEAFPDLAQDPSSLAFAEAVHDIQRAVFEDEEDWDGKLGNGTWRAIKDNYGDHLKQVGPWVNRLIHDGQEIALPEGRSYQFINFNDGGGLDLHREKDYNEGRKLGQGIDYIVWHWGAFSAQSLFNVFENAKFDKKGNIVSDKRNVSSHGGLDLQVAEDQVYFYQFLDTIHRAWHAAGANSRSVGLDICQQPTEKWLKKLKKKGWNVELVDNPNPRGRDKIVTLEPRLAKAARELTEDLCAALGIPFRIPRGKDGLEETGEPYHGVIPREALTGKGGASTFRGVIGHHHVVKTKWDIAPWWGQIFGDL